jgi:glycosyltransferase involved in cell wall biosynthesis
MLISVIVPVYNEEKFLRKCLDSIKDCPSKEIECIIVNDGSTDGSTEISQCYANEDSRFRLINKKNSGVSEARNRGMAEAAGEYIIFLDADDYIVTSKWPEILAHAVENTFDIIVYSFYYQSPSGTVRETRFPDSCDIRTALLSTTVMNSSCGRLMRRGVIARNNLSFRKDMKIYEDALFNIDFVQNAEKCLLLNTSVMYYRCNASGAMQSTGMEAKLDDFTALFERRKEFLSINYDKKIEKLMYRQFFSVITDLFRSYTRSRKISEIRPAYKKNLEHPVVAAILAETRRACLASPHKKLEHILMSCRFYTCIAVYFKTKGLLKFEKKVL